MNEQSDEKLQGEGNEQQEEKGSESQDVMEEKANEVPKDEGTGEEGTEFEHPGEGEEPDMDQFMLPTDVYSLSQFFMSLLGNSAWQHLGLIPDPRTKKIEMDLKQAGIAIDIMTTIYDKVKDSIDTELSSGIRDLLSNLRINYVNKMKEDEASKEES